MVDGLRLVASYNAIGLHGGIQHFAKEKETRTLCGRDRSNWMDMRAAEPNDIESAWTCTRCIGKLNP